MAERPLLLPRVGGWLASASDALVNVFFPGECRLCERLLTSRSRIPICEGCLAGFKPLQGPLCDVCGQPIGAVSFGSLPELKEDKRFRAREDQPVRTICRSCELITYSFDRARSYGLYEGDLVRGIVMLKFERIEPLACWFAQRLAEVTQNQQLTSFDAVFPVPLHRKRERERGYNQAELIAQPLAKLLDLPCETSVLERKRPRPDKHILSLKERWDSVRGAFATQNGSKVDKLRVLLVDDVFTTGATLNACAKVLRKAGAKSVIGLTIARAARHPVGSVEV